MFLSKPQFIEDVILNELKKGPLKSSDLVSTVKKLRSAKTKQGVYKTLKKLNSEEIITLKKGIITLNTVWLRKLHNYLATAQKNYLDKIILPGYFTNLEEGERFIFNFKNPELLDSYWGHVLVTLMQIIPPDKHFFAYNPQYWFILARRENEERFLQSVKESGRQFLMTVAGKNYLDKKLTGILDKSFFQYYMLGKPLFKKNNYYINAIDDYVIEVLIDERISKQIENFYEQATKLDDNAIIGLKKIISQEGKNKFIISRNKRKADKFRNMVKKYFYTPKT